MSARLLSFVIWALAAASAVYWASRLLVRPVAVPAQALAAVAAPPAGGSLTRVFGTPPPEPVATPAPVVVESRFKLVGVVAGRAGQRGGLALISIDDKPARAVPIGARVDGEWVVKSIAHRQVDLGPSAGPAALTLTLPTMAEAARGVPGMGGSPAPGGAPVFAPSVPPNVSQPMPAAPTFQRPFGAGRAFPQNVAPGQANPGGAVAQEAQPEGQIAAPPPTR